MNIGKIILGIILLALIPTHWFVGGIVLSTLVGFPGIFVVLIWVMLLAGGISLIFAGLNEPDVVVYHDKKYPSDKRHHVDIDVKNEKK